MTQTSLSPRQRIESSLGFRAAAIPLILLLGLVAILGTTPGLVAHQIGRLDSSSAWESTVRDRLVSLLTDWNRFYDSIEVAKIDQAILPSALCMSLVLAAASLIRSFKAGTFRPTIATWAGLTVGFFVLPALLWLWSALAFIWNLLWSFEHAVAHFLRHMPSALKIAGIVILLIVAAIMVVCWAAIFDQHGFRSFAASHHHRRDRRDHCRRFALSIATFAALHYCNICMDSCGYSIRSHRFCHYGGSGGGAWPSRAYGVPECESIRPSGQQPSKVYRPEHRSGINSFANCPGGSFRWARRIRPRAYRRVAAQPTLKPPANATALLSRDTPCWTSGDDRTSFPGLQPVSGRPCPAADSGDRDLELAF